MLQFQWTSAASLIDFTFLADHGAMAAYTLTDVHGLRGSSPNNGGSWSPQVSPNPPFDPLGESFVLSILTASINGKATNIRMTAAQNGVALPEMSGAPQSPNGYLLTVVPPNGAATPAFWVGA